jgi:AP-2 complex subunit beta-1
MSYVPKDTSEALLLAERIAPRLSHSNSAVVLTSIRVILYFMNYIADEKQITAMSKKLSPPLVTLLSKPPEVQYLALRNAILILQKRPDVLRNDIRVFFCKYNDPIYVKVTKLELIFMLTTKENISVVLAELREYALIPSQPMFHVMIADVLTDMPRKSTCISYAKPCELLESWP